MSLQDVLIDELRDLYSAENQLVKALPKSVKGASDANMKQVLKDHLEETKGQVLRLREVFQHIGKKPTGKHCSGMEGCVSEVTEALGEDETGALKDAGLLGASLRVEHYEIAGYTAAIAMAKTLGEKEIVDLLNQSLKEEQNAAKNILNSSKSILKDANSQEEEDDEEEDEDDEPKDAEEQESEQKSEQDEQEAAPDVQGATKGKKKSAKKK